MRAVAAGFVMVVAGVSASACAGDEGEEGSGTTQLGPMSPGSSSAVNVVPASSVEMMRDGMMTPMPGAPVNMPTPVGDPTAQVIGAPCSTTADCMEDSYCHVDYDLYVGNATCAVPCETTEQCQARFGLDSICIGANICVRNCETDVDCPAGSVCNDFSWCENPAGQPQCTGVATPCSLLDSIQCIGAQGCTDNAACSGVAESCSLQFDEFSCTAVDGCSWLSSIESCSGVSDACSSYFSSGFCELQPGCRWSGGCTGIAQACEDTSFIYCPSHPGCTLIEPL